jgi:nitrogen regulatory protein P-II 1
MTKVQATIRESQLQAVVERLLLIGVRGLTLWSVQGFGRSGGHDAVYKGSAYRTMFQPKMLVEWCGSDEEADAVVRAIVRSGATGKVGDGKIFVIPIDEVVRIRTGERGEAAL